MKTISLPVLHRRALITDTAVVLTVLMLAVAEFWSRYSRYLPVHHVTAAIGIEL